MKKLSMLLVLVSWFGNAQERFTFTKDGFTDYVVTPVKGKNASELYLKTIEWISKKYKNPKEVIKADLKDDYLRIEGFSNNLLLFNTMGKQFYDAKYQIEITFKDGKYKFDVISVDLINTKSKPEMTLTDMSEYYKKDGKLKGTYKYFPDVFSDFFNLLNIELNQYLNGKSSENKKDW